MPHMDWANSDQGSAIELFTQQCKQYLSVKEVKKVKQVHRILFTRANGIRMFNSTLYLWECFVKCIQECWLCRVPQRNASRTIMWSWPHIMAQKYHSMAQYNSKSLWWMSGDQHRFLDCGFRCGPAILGLSSSLDHKVVTLEIREWKEESRLTKTRLVILELSPLS